MRKLKTILQSRYLFKIIALIVVISSLIIVKFYPYHSIYSGDETVFYGKILSLKIDGDKLTIVIKKKKNYL